MHQLRRALIPLLCLWLAMPAALAQALSVQVYSLRHQLAAGLVPSVQATLHEGESVHAFNNELVVNASADSHRQVAQLLQALDKPLRNLRISVRNSSDTVAQGSSAGATGSIRTGDVYLGTGGPVYRDRRPDNGVVVQHDGLRVHANRSQSGTQATREQQLRAIEGQPAWISTGQTIAYRSVDAWGNPVTSFRDANRGFYITARIVDQRVYLDISASDDRLSEDPRLQRRGVIDTAQLQTSVTGAVGEWINLGGISLQDSRSSRDYTSRDSSMNDTIGDIAVMVVPAD